MLHLGRKSEILKTFTHADTWKKEEMVLPVKIPFGQNIFVTVVEVFQDHICKQESILLSIT